MSTKKIIFKKSKDTALRKRRKKVQHKTVNAVYKLEEILSCKDIKIGLTLFPRWLRDKESACNAGDKGLTPGSRRSPGEGNSNGKSICLHRGRPGFDPWVGRYWRRQWQPTPALLPGKPHGRRSWQTTVHGAAKRRTRLSDFTSAVFLPGKPHGQRGLEGHSPWGSQRLKQLNYNSSSIKKEKASNYLFENSIYKKNKYMYI